MYRVHDHRQTHADKVSLKMDRNIYNNLYNKTHTSRNFILWSHLTWPPTCNPHFTSLIENLKISLLPTYKPPFVEHMREHSLFWATTKRMFVLPSILSHNSKNTPTFDPWDIAQSLVDHAHPKQAKHNVCFIKNRLTLPTSCKAQKVSRPPGGGHVPPGAKNLWCYSFYKYPLAGQPLSPSATRFNSPLVL